jgi:excisionase family DNA binding protein
MPTQALPRYRQWITQADAAERLSVTDRTVRNLIARGDLHGYRIGKSRTIRIDAAEVDNLLRPIPTANGGGAR